MLRPDQPLRIGDAANLLHGLRAEWLDTESRSTPFRSPPRQPFATFGIDAPNAAAEWSGPTLSLHQNLDTLADALFDYRVLPFHPAQSGFDVSASVLMLSPEDRAAAQAALGARLGLDLASPDAGGFLLVKMRRVDAAFMHEAERGGVGKYIRIHNYWTPEGRNGMGRLRVAERIFDGAAREATVAPRQAQRYLDYFYEFGTHFVSRVELGDAIVQVFAIKSSRYPHLSDTLHREAGSTRASGALALAFRFATGPDWALAKGKIVSASGDSAVAQSVASGLWGESLLEPFAKDARAQLELLASFSKAIPIGIDFAPQSSFMEVFRADAWKRLLKGALHQRFGARIRIPSARAEPERSIRAAEPFGEFGLVARFGSPPVMQLPGARPLVFAYQAIASSPTGEVPMIAIEDEAFDRFEFVAAGMRGTLIVANPDESRRETICEGFRFATVGEAGRADGARVALRGDTWSPSAEGIRSAAPAIEASLEFAEALLSTREAPFAREYLEWLARILSEDRSYDEMRIRALYLAREQARLEPARAAIDEGWLSDVLDLANRICILATQARASAADSNSAAFASALRQAADQAEALLGQDALPANDPSRVLFEKARLIKVATRLSLSLDEAVSRAGLATLGAPSELELGSVTTALIQKARALQRHAQAESTSPRLKASET